MAMTDQENAYAAYERGVALQQAGKPGEAVAAWWQAVRHDPAHAAAWGNLVLGLAMLGDEGRAFDACREALAHHPRDMALLRHHVNLAYALGDLAEGEKASRILTALAHDDGAAWLNRGRVLKELRRHEEAEACYRHALSCGTHEETATFNLAALLLQQGKWRDGFAAYEARLKLPGTVACPWDVPRWTPDTASGSKILLWNDQGLGDAIMFARFAPLLATRGCRLFACVQQPLKSLFATVPGIEAAFDLTDAPQPMDAALPLASLPYALGLDNVDVWNGPYLRVPEPSSFCLPPRTDDTRRIGLVWGGNAAHINDRNRSMQLADLVPLFGIPGIEWFSLQQGDRKAELTDYPAQDLSEHLNSLSDTAGILSQLDLLISVDTAPAHLAGALNLPVRVLLPAIGCDWRWGSEGDRTFWYPSMRLFRQAQPRNWTPSVAAIKQELERS
ncbi:MAG: glycosyltransferase family protein [Alphaproteobacteria bacterium]|nr:glycosyltransferase family protein [Alphaproteobacteria bacterium]